MMRKTQTRRARVKIKKNVATQPKIRMERKNEKRRAASR